MTDPMAAAPRSGKMPSGNLDQSLPTLELRVPISPRDKDLRMIHYLLESIQEFGGPISRAAHCVASVGADESPRDLASEYPWCANYSIEFQWLDRAFFRQREYDATGLHRLWVKSDADVVAQVDADLLVTGDFDDVIIRSHREQVLLGCVAHVSPFEFPDWEGTSESGWNVVFEEAGLPPPVLDWTHSGWGLMSADTDHRECPAYVNYGFLVSPRSFVESMATSFEAELDAVDRVADNWAKSQIAVTLSIARHGFPCDALDLKYNFPLHVPCDAIRALNPEPNGEQSYEDVRIFHYLGDGEINRKDFETPQSVEKVLGRTQMSPAAQVFQRKLKIVDQRIQSQLGRGRA